MINYIYLFDTHTIVFFEKMKKNVKKKSSRMRKKTLIFKMSAK